jgi:hypothetical protein
LESSEAAMGAGAQRLVWRVYELKNMRALRGQTPLVVSEKMTFEVWTNHFVKAF